MTTIYHPEQNSSWMAEVLLRLLPVQPSQFSECASTSLTEPPVNNSDQIVNGALSTLNIYTANLLL